MLHALLVVAACCCLQAASDSTATTSHCPVSRSGTCVSDSGSSCCAGSSCSHSASGVSHAEKHSKSCCCCSHAADTAAAAKDSAKVAANPASRVKVYTCPMHPEVRQSEQGRCPQCGMKLVEASKTTGDATEKAAQDSAATSKPAHSPSSSHSH
jgi:hypothetical protein